jgi:hypothetical protein
MLLLSLSLSLSNPTFTLVPKSIPKTHIKVGSPFHLRYHLIYVLCPPRGHIKVIKQPRSLLLLNTLHCNLLR